jgi:hypothetical protein
VSYDSPRSNNKSSRHQASREASHIPSRVCSEKQKCAKFPGSHPPVSAVGHSKRRLPDPTSPPLRLCDIRCPTVCECLHWDTGSPTQPPAHTISVVSRGLWTSLYPSDLSDTVHSLATSHCETQTTRTSDKPRHRRLSSLSDATRKIPQGTDLPGLYAIETITLQARSTCLPIFLTP